MARRMADPRFLRDQRARLSEPHIAPINAFVHALRDRDERGWVPEVAPMHAGVDARVLSILRDPGPATRSGQGSGFLCSENDDPTAEAQTNLFVTHGIDPRDVLPWNAYPWYINAAPNASQLDAGADVLCELLDLLPDLRVVLLQGKEAEDGWRRFLRRRPRVIADRDVTVAVSIHPSRQALWTADPTVRQARLDKQAAAYRSVACALSSPGKPPAGSAIGIS